MTWLLLLDSQRCCSHGSDAKFNIVVKRLTNPPHLCLVAVDQI